VGTARVAELDRKSREYLSDLARWRRAYLATYLAWFGAGGSPEPQGRPASIVAPETRAASNVPARALRHSQCNHQHQTLSYLRRRSA
jgi:hypothetical protein